MKLLNAQAESKPNSSFYSHPPGGGIQCVLKAPQQIWTIDLKTRVLVATIVSVLLFWNMILLQCWLLPREELLSASARLTFVQALEQVKPLT